MRSPWIFFFFLSITLQIRRRSRSRPVLFMLDMIRPTREWHTFLKVGHPKKILYDSRGKILRLLASCDVLLPPG